MITDEKRIKKALYDKNYRKILKEKNPNYSTENMRKWRKENPKAQRNQVLQRLYGITLEDYNVLFERQQGCCAICEKHQVEFKTILNVDHCHTTGKVRALLCTKCNVGLGIYENWKDKFKEYLEWH